MLALLHGHPKPKLPCGWESPWPTALPMRDAARLSQGSWVSLSSHHVSPCGVFPGSIVSFARCLVMSPRLSSIRLIPGGPYCGVPSRSGGCLGPVSPHCSRRASTCRGPTSPLLAFPAICVHCGFRLWLWVQQPPLLTLLHPNVLNLPLVLAPGPGTQAAKPLGWCIKRSSVGFE